MRRTTKPSSSPGSKWPDKATREEAIVRMHDLMDTDRRFDEKENPVPFDGKRMIYGGFALVVEL